MSARSAAVHTLFVPYFAVQSTKSGKLSCIIQYNGPMKHKSVVLQIRISDSEKEAFGLAAALAGISLSSWVRERLRLTAIRELEGAGRRVPFVSEIPMGGSGNGRA